VHTFSVSPMESKKVYHPWKGNIKYAAVSFKYAQSVHKEFLVYTLCTLYWNFTIKCAHEMLDSPIKHKKRCSQRFAEY
jgi:hypothetical protein